jgi:sugar phosphate isomerase/epimerase
MIRSAVTVCLVPEAGAGPFVLHGNLAASCAYARSLGFDAIELFPPSAKDVPLSTLRSALDPHQLAVAAVGSGAGWVRHKLSLTDPNEEVRAQALAFAMGLVNFAGYVGAPVIIGSMQGRVAEGTSREQALDWLAAGLKELSDRSASHGQCLLYEPLNRYETNLFNRVGDTSAFLEARGLSSVKILADLFHMNIEEVDIAKALRDAGPRLGHIHFADSNRHAIGHGHTPLGPIASALKAIGYDGFISAEVLPLPDPQTAARQTIAKFQQWFR